MNRRVNFNDDVPLNPIPEDQHDNDNDTVSSEDEGRSEFARSHSIHEIASAKAASRIFRLKSLESKKNKKRDEGFAEVIIIIIITSTLIAVIAVCCDQS